MAPGLTDGESGHGNASGHLYDGEQRIESIEGGGLDGNPRTGRMVQAAVTPARWAAPPRRR